MADASSGALARRRKLIWGSLLALLAAACILLVLALKSREEPAPAPGAGGADVRRPVVVRVVDVKGHPVPEAHAFVSQRADAPPEEAGSWDAETATLELPFTGVPRNVVVQARGFKTRRVEDVVGDLTVELEPGYLARFVLVPKGTLPDPPAALYVRINPSRAEDVDLSDAEANTILGLMEAVEPAPEGVPEPPRARFGLLLSAARAAAGVRVPIPGPYVAKWGLMDEDVGTWYGLYESVLDVTEDTPVSRLEIGVTEEAVALTLEKLREQVDRIRGAAKDAADDAGD